MVAWGWEEVEDRKQGMTADKYSKGFFWVQWKCSKIDYRNSCAILWLF